MAGRSGTFGLILQCLAHDPAPSVRVLDFIENDINDKTLVSAFLDGIELDLLLQIFWSWEELDSFRERFRRCNIPSEVKSLKHPFSLRRWFRNKVLDLTSTLKYWTSKFRKSDNGNLLAQVLREVYHGEGIPSFISKTDLGSLSTLSLALNDAVGDYRLYAIVIVVEEGPYPKWYDVDNLFITEYFGGEILYSHQMSTEEGIAYVTNKKWPRRFLFGDFDHKFWASFIYSDLALVSFTHVSLGAPSFPYNENTAPNIDGCDVLENLLYWSGKSLSFLRLDSVVEETFYINMETEYNIWLPAQTDTFQQLKTLVLSGHRSLRPQLIHIILSLSPNLAIIKLFPLHCLDNLTPFPKYSHPSFRISYMSD